jgi:protoporphyrinogen oxidase
VEELISMNESRDVIIIGAGPAGLTCATELIEKNAHLKIAIFEGDSQVGGISKTVNHNGNRIDLGGHRFFSKSDWVMEWWRKRFPINNNGAIATISYQNKRRTVGSSTQEVVGDNVLLLRQRLSRIYYRRQFFDYPLKFNFDTFSKLGLVYTIQCGLSLLRSRFIRRNPELSLEDFFINRFGDRLYRTFFKDYT